MKKGTEWALFIHNTGPAIARRLQDEGPRETAINFLETCSLLEGVAIGHFMTAPVTLKDIAQRLSECGCPSQTTPEEAVRLLLEEINVKA